MIISVFGRSLTKSPTNIGHLWTISLLIGHYFEPIAQRYMNYWTGNYKNKPQGNCGWSQAVENETLLVLRGQTTMEPWPVTSLRSTIGGVFRGQWLQLAECDAVGNWDNAIGCYMCAYEHSKCFLFYKMAVQTWDMSRHLCSTRGGPPHCPP